MQYKIHFQYKFIPRRIKRRPFVLPSSGSRTLISVFVFVKDDNDEGDFRD